ncbi:hypothetical protein [Rhodococcus opacus]|uniref:hypothetical protein n=1 Tax=Rhodococcus opacus TaxID=37919 RepID=UPI00155AB977|nr:hypothetical protein [Rhodococcus opacus]
MPRARSNEDTRKVPVIHSAPLPELPDEHPLRTLAYIAASPRGLDLGHRAWLAQPQMTRFAPILAGLHRKAQAVRRQGGAAAPEQVDTATEGALLALADALTPNELQTGRLSATAMAPPPPPVHRKPAGRPRKAAAA